MAGLLQRIFGGGDQDVDVKLSEKLSRPTARRVNYDAASAHAAMTNHFKSAGTDTNNAALESDVATVTSRARYELRNNATAVFVQQIYPDMLVGTGPVPRIECNDAAWADRAERNFQAWARSCGYGRGESFGMLLHAGVMEWFPCGEFLLIPRTAKRVGPRENGLRFLPVSPDRLQTPVSGFGSNSFYRGIELDADGIPHQYWIVNNTSATTSALGIAPTDFKEVPAAEVIHGFRGRETGQLRGEPLAAQMLHIFSKIRRHNEATLSAAEVAALFAAFIEGDVDLDQDADTLEMEELPINPATMSILPPGYKVSQLKPEHPAAMYREFRRENFAEAGRAAGLTAGTATGDHSGYNFSSANKDDQITHRGFAVRRMYLENQVCDPVFRQWLREEMLCGALPRPSAGYSVSWLWPGVSLHVDPVKVANGTQTDLRNGVTVLEDEWIRRGQDPDKMRAKVKKQAEWMKETGLTFGESPPVILEERDES